MFSLITRKPFPFRSWLVCLFLTISVTVNAQFYSVTGEKSLSEWSEVRTRNFQLIYPEGLDSLGLRYLNKFETYYNSVGNTVGFFPNQRIRKPLPIVLHPYMAETNGVTVLAPHRLELFPFTDAYSELPPISLETSLAIHESRHSAQMQFAYYGFWRSFPILFGGAAPMVIDALYLNTALAEGDAVVAETALTNSGRGRTAGFLSYYRMAFDNGDKRDWFRWRYGSQIHYTPDYYRIGYMTVAGARCLYDAPMFMSDYLYWSLNPFHVNAFARTLKIRSGKNIKKSWDDIADLFESTWQADDKARGPFQEIKPMISDKSRFFRTYSGSVQTKDGRLLTVYSGMDRSTELAEILPGGRVMSLRPFNADSKIVYSPYTDCIYWTEGISDVRWEMYRNSRIRMMKVGENSIRDFADEGMFANPSISEDGKQMAVVAYFPDGNCRMVLYSLEDGFVIRSIRNKPGVMMLESAFCGDKVVFTGVSDDGIGLYMTDFESIVTLESPAPFKVYDLLAKDGVIYFTSDKTGTDEIYSYTVSASERSGILKQLTNTRYGVTDPFFFNGELCFVALQPQGRIPARTGELEDRTVTYQEHASYPIADKLTEQEKRRMTPPSDYDEPVHASYSKGQNGIKLHSWMPLYVSMNGFTGSVTGYKYEEASMGATAFFQNLPTTLQGSIGVSFHEYLYDEGNPMMAGFHTRLEYSGLFPKFSLSFDIGDRKPVTSIKGEVEDADSGNYETVVSNQDDSNHPVFMGGSLVMSVPLDFSSGGWNRKLNPFAGVMASTDMVSDTYCLMHYSDDYGAYSIDAPDVTLEYYPIFSLVAGVTGGVETNTAKSAIFPRWGVGGGIRYLRNTFSSSFYANAYGYVPGLNPVHGLRLSASMQLAEQATGSAKADIWGIDALDMAPRGYADTPAEFFFVSGFRNTYKVSADYAMPILPLDWSLAQYLYLRNLELLPFLDYTWTENGPETEKMLSVGADLMFRFEKLLFSNTAQKIGLRFSYNKGTIDDMLGMDTPFYFGAVAGVSF